MKIDMSPCLSERLSDYFELYERHVIKNEKGALDRLRVRQNAFLVAKETDVLLWSILRG